MDFLAPINRCMRINKQYCIVRPFALSFSAEPRKSMGSPHTSSTAYIRGIGVCLQLSIAVDAFLFNKLSTLFCWL